MGYAYFPGCSLKGMAIEYEMSVKADAQILGIELTEVPDWTCCGASAAHAVDSQLAIDLAQKNIDQAKKLGKTTMTTPCPACFSRLRVAQMASGDESMAIKSLLQVYYEEKEGIKERIKKPLEGLKVAPYYGCLLVRPKEVSRFDSPENPGSMDEILKICGAEVIDFPFKTDCCGASAALTKKNLCLKLSGKILKMAVSRGAKAVVVACPLCHQNLDLRQAQIEKALGEKFNTPIYYFTQIIGLALGLSASVLGIDRHAVKATERGA